MSQNKAGYNPLLNANTTKTIAPKDGENHPIKSGTNDNAIANAATIAPSTHAILFTDIKKPPCFFTKRPIVDNYSYNPYARINVTGSKSL